MFTIRTDVLDTIRGLSEAARSCQEQTKAVQNAIDQLRVSKSSIFLGNFVNTPSMQSLTGGLALKDTLSGINVFNKVSKVSQIWNDDLLALPSRVPSSGFSSNLASLAMSVAAPKQPVLTLHQGYFYRTRKHTQEEFREDYTTAKQTRLVSAYDIICHLELAVRDLIEQELSSKHGKQWWKRAIPENIRKQCEERKQNKEKAGESVYHPICYAYVNDYKDIIVRSDNWRDVFSLIFLNKEELSVCFAWVAEVRDQVAHSRPISDMAYQRMYVAAKVLHERIQSAVSQRLTGS